MLMSMTRKRQKAAIADELCAHGSADCSGPRFPGQIRNYPKEFLLPLNDVAGGEANKMVHRQTRIAWALNRYRHFVPELNRPASILPFEFVKAQNRNFL